MFQLPSPLIQPLLWRGITYPIGAGYIPNELAESLGLKEKEPEKKILAIEAKKKPAETKEA